MVPASSPISGPVGRQPFAECVVSLLVLLACGWGLGTDRPYEENGGDDNKYEEEAAHNNKKEGLKESGLTIRRFRV